MNLQNLFVMQKKLDKNIVETHNLCNKSLFSEKILALQVELAELANETRCFKFWSNKGPSPKNTILEEYVDCLHFILTIGLDKNFIYSTFNISKEDIALDLTNQFLSIYIDINDFIICASKDHYETLLEDFLCLGVTLGFSEKDIEEAYHRKNAINHKRQAIGY